MQVIIPSLTYAGTPDKKEEILALFDKVIQSLKVLYQYVKTLPDKSSPLFGYNFLI